MMWRTTVVAITGSVGKTTAKECLAAALQPHGATLKTFQNQNDRYGVPHTILAMRPWHRYAVVEVGAGGPGDVRRLARVLRPDIAVVLRVARTHTARFGSLESTAAEKAELLRFLPKRGLAVLNADDERVHRMAEGLGVKTVVFGTAACSHLRAESVESRWPDRLRFDLAAGERTIPVQTRLVGAHWAGSVLAALAAADACGVPIEDAVERVGRVRPFMARMQPVMLPGGAVVIRDEENGSPDSLAAMLAVLREARASRRGLVFSDQSDSRQSPRQRLRDMGRVTAELCDFAAFVGEHAHHAARAATAAGMDTSRCRAFASLQEAAQWLRDLLRRGDLVFLKGRSTDHLSRILFAQLGDIGCWIARCEIRRPCDVCPRLRPGFDLERALVEPVAGETW